MAVDGVLKNKKVLLVDDDERNQFALKLLLTSWEMDVVIARNGQEYINILGEDLSIDIVLMDIMMPVMDGYEAMRKTRNITRYSELPIIALTAKAMKGDKKRCMEAGATGYLSKPIDTDKLASAIRELV